MSKIIQPGNNRTGIASRSVSLNIRPQYQVSIIPSGSNKMRIYGWEFQEVVHVVSSIYGSM